MAHEQPAKGREVPTGILLAVGEFPDGGATAMRLRLMSRAIRAGGLGIQVAILHSTAKSPIPGNERVEGEVDGVRFRYLSGRAIRPASVVGAFWDTVSGIGRFLANAVLKRQKPGFVIFYTPTFWKMIIPLLASRLRGIPVFIEACEVWSAIEKDDLGTLKRRLVASGDRWLEKWTPRLVRGVIPISHHIADFYRGLGVPEDRLLLLPILVDVDRYKQCADAEIERLKSVDYFLSSGSLGEKDGLAFMLEAFERVADEFPNVRIVFTGGIDEDTKQKALARIREPGHRDMVIFTGFLGREQLVWAYQHAQAVLCCRSNSAYANFGFPTKLGEYLASGTPVIATRVGDVDRYLEDGKSAYLAEPENPGSIADCMLKALKDPNLAAQVGVEGRKIAERYFWYPVYSQPIAKFLLDHV